MRVRIRQHTITTHPYQLNMKGSKQGVIQNQVAGDGGVTIIVRSTRDTPAEDNTYPILPGGFLSWDVPIDDDLWLSCGAGDSVMYCIDYIEGTPP